MNMKFIGIISLMLMLSSCGFFGGDERPVYQGAEYYKNLEIPPDLTAPDTSGQLLIPKPSSEALHSFKKNNDLGVVVKPSFDGIRLVNNSGDSWLEIDKNAAYVWGRLLAFWESEGIELINERPLLGFMETDWTVRSLANMSFLQSLFQKLEPTQKEKFRVRVEKNKDDTKTRLYVTHSRIERSVTGEYGESVVWLSVPSDVEAESEILSRLVLFAGKNKAQAAELLKNYQSYSSLVAIDKTNTTTLTMKGSSEFVWNRTMRALDRMNMQDIRQERESNTIYFVVGEISNQYLNKEEDEVSQSSWLMNLFTDIDDKDLSSDIDRHYHLVLSVSNNRVLIEVIDEEETLNKDEDGYVSSTALAEQLRNILVEELE